jgi:hypothetical protein
MTTSDEARAGEALVYGVLLALLDMRGGGSGFDLTVVERPRYGDTGPEPGLESHLEIRVGSQRFRITVEHRDE